MVRSRRLVLMSFVLDSCTTTAYTAMHSFCHKVSTVEGVDWLVIRLRHTFFANITA